MKPVQSQSDNNLKPSFINELNKLFSHANKKDSVALDKIQVSAASKQDQGGFTPNQIRNVRVEVAERQFFKVEEFLRKKIVEINGQQVDVPNKDLKEVDTNQRQSANELTNASTFSSIKTYFSQSLPISTQVHGGDIEIQSAKPPGDTRNLAKQLTKSETNSFSKMTAFSMEKEIVVDQSISSISGNSSSQSSDSNSGEEGDEEQMDYLKQQINQLNEFFEKQQSFQCYVSSLLKDFYKNNGNDNKTVAQYCNEIVHANRCLLVSAEKQSLIDQQMQRIVAQSSAKGAKSLVDQSSLMANQPINACLVIRSVGLTVRDNSMSLLNKNEPLASECYVICLVEHQLEVIHSSVLNTSVDLESLQFDVNHIFNNLTPDFEVMIKFFTMNHSVVNFYRKHDHRKPTWNRAWTSLVHCLRPNRKACALLNSSQQSLKALLNTTTTANDHGSTYKLARHYRSDIEMEEPLSTAFKLLGQVRINLANWRGEKMTLEHFDYCSTLENKVQLDLELVMKYQGCSSWKFEGRKSCVTNVEIDIVQMSAEQHRIDRKYKKRQQIYQLKTLKIEENKLHLQFSAPKSGFNRSQSGSFQYLTFNLASCLNPVSELDLALLSQNKISFIFKVFNHRSVKFVDHSSSVNRAPKSRVSRLLPLTEARNIPVEFKVVSIWSDKRKPLLENLYWKVVERIKAVRQWEPVLNEQTIGADDSYLLGIESRNQLAQYLLHSF